MAKCTVLVSKHVVRIVSTVRLYFENAMCLRIFESKGQKLARGKRKTSNEEFFRSLHGMLLEDEMCGHVAGMGKFGNFRFHWDKFKIEYDL